MSLVLFEILGVVTVYEKVRLFHRFFGVVHYTVKFQRENPVLASEFEKKYFQQPCYWIGGIEFNILKSELTISLVANLEFGDIEGVFVFSQIVNYQGDFVIDDYDPECIENLIGITTSDTPEGLKYCINFGIGEILFVTKAQPIIKWRDPKKCRVYMLHEERIQK